jgi:hypothetical protein
MAKRTYTHAPTLDGRPVVVHQPRGSLDEPASFKTFGLFDSMRALRGRQ